MIEYLCSILDLFEELEQKEGIIVSIVELC